jgi:WD40 repeat protein
MVRHSGNRQGGSGWCGVRIAALGLAAACLLKVDSASAQISRPLEAHSAAVYSLAFSPAGGLLVSGSSDRTLKFHRLSDGPLAETEQERRRSLLTALDDERFAVRQQAFVQLAALGDAMEPDLRQTLDSPRSAEVRLRVMRLLQALSVPAGVGHQGDVRSVAVSRDGAWVASAGRDSQVILWSVSSGRPLRVLEGHSEGVWSVAFAPHAAMLASGGGDQTIRLWSADTGELLQTLTGHGSTVHQLVFSPDGKTLASAGGFDKTCRLWDVETGRVQAVLDRHTDAVLCLAFSPDGRHLASSGYDGAVHLWSVAGPQFEAELRPGRDVVRSVAFSPDGRRLASAGDDQLIQIWDVATRTRTDLLRVHTDAVNAVAFSPDGKRLASAGRDGSILLWTLDAPSGSQASAAASP